MDVIWNGTRERGPYLGAYIPPPEPMIPPPLPGPKEIAVRQRGSWLHLDAQIRVVLEAQDGLRAIDVLAILRRKQTRVSQSKRHAPHVQMVQVMRTLLRGLKAGGITRTRAWGEHGHSRYRWHLAKETR